MDKDVPQYLRDHARHLDKRSSYLTVSTMLYDSPDGLALLALIATHGRSTYEGLLAEARAVIAAGKANAAPPIDVEALAGIARIKAGQPGPELDYTEAADLHQAIRILRTTEPLRRDVDLIDAQTNFAVGRFAYVDRILPHVAVAGTPWMLRTELLHPDHGRPGSSATDWMHSFNEVFREVALSPIDVEQGVGTRFDRLSSVTPRMIDDGPLVTLIMSVFAPDASLKTAVTSLLAQTWRNLEILVVDDCSPPEYAELIESVSDLDERIQLLQMPQNGGTYKIRNYAMARARGEFIGFQDSDDWSHPERIEKQLEPLLADSSVVATMSRSVRVYPELGISQVGYKGQRQNASSLLFRREPVLDALAGFDEVRKGADSEFERRLRTHFGEPSLVNLSLPLALVQLTRDSLSRGEFRLGHQAGTRVAYRYAYEHWQDGCSARGESLRLEPGRPRRFPAPPRFIGRAEPVPSASDVLVVSDWRPGLGRYLGGLQEAAALAGSGLTTAVAHAETLRYARRKRESPSGDLMALLSDGSVVSPLWSDDFRSRLLVINDPELLSYARPGAAVGLRSDRVIIRANFPPRAPEGEWLVYEPAVVQRRARELFGTEPEWLPAHEGVAKALVSEGAQAILPPTRLAAIGLPALRRSGLRGGHRPIIGIAGIESPLKDRPTREALLALFPDDDRYDVRIHDTDGTLDKFRPAEPWPPNWLISANGSLTSFVRQLDVFLGIPHRSWGPEPTHAAALAMAQGCVVVLDPAYEPHFGDAAVYLDGRPPRQHVDALVKDRAGFVEQQQRGYDFIAAEMTPRVFVDRIGALLDSEIEEKRSA